MDARTLTLLCIGLTLFAGTAGCESTSNPFESVANAAVPQVEAEAPADRPLPTLRARTIGLRPPPGDDEDLVVAVISDLNASYGSKWYPEPVHRAVERLIEIDPDVVLGAGDMVAGQHHGLDYPGMWNAFHEAVSDKLFDAGIPFAPSPGNHDASGYPQYGEERDWYERAWKWRMPPLAYVNDDNNPFQYAFTLRNVLFVSLNATVARPMGPEQRDWLRQVLVAHPHVTSTVMYGHLPIYPFARGRRWDTLDDPDLEEMLLDLGVDLYVSGHHQAYYDGSHNGLRMVSTGCLGNGVRTLLGDDRPSMRTIVMLRISPEGDITVTALTGETFEEIVQLDRLPETVGDGHRQIVRYDLARHAHVPQPTPPPFISPDELATLRRDKASNTTP